MKAIRALFKIGCLLVIAALVLDILRMMRGKEDVFED